MKKLKKSLSVFLAIITIITSCSIAMPVFAEGNLFASENTANEFYEPEEMTSKIVSEVKELREEYAKHFVCEDGSYIVATYSDPVHYKENGQWKEINNSLELSDDVKSSSGKAMYTPKSGNFDVKIPQSFSNGQMVSATNKGYTISFGANRSALLRNDTKATVVNEIDDLSSNVQTDQVSFTQKQAASSADSTTKQSEIATYNSEAMTVKNQVGGVVYEDVFDNSDLEYIVTTNSIKENIVVNEKQDKYIYSFNMDFGELTPVINEDNSISLVESKTNETVFYIAAPYMYDANNMESSDIDLTLAEKDGKYILTLQANADWIDAPERAFPVVIDPTVYLSYDDVFVMNGVTYKNTTRITKELRVGRNLTNLTRTYIMPTLPTNIPAGSYINSAYLKLTKDYYYQAPLANDISILAFDCYDVASWKPTSVTWENQPYSKANNGYDNGHPYISSVAATSSKTTYSFNITSAARRWLSGGVNNGLMLASSDESAKTQIDFHSSRATKSTAYPEVYITYTAPALSISSWETGSQASETSFKISTAGNWTASANVDWISLGATSGTTSNGSSTNKIIVKENTSTKNRTGTVTVKFGNTIIGTINVTQYGADAYITLDTTKLNFEAGNNKQTINIKSNTVWSFGELPDWVTVTPSTGSKDSAATIEVSENHGSAARECVITVTADTATQNVNITQAYDSVSPVAPSLYEENGLVFISANSFDFDESKDSPEYIEYKLDSGEWTAYNGEPLSVIRTYDVTIYARMRDAAGNVSKTTSLVLECDLGEYTASYTDIVLGEGVLPVGFDRTYSSEDGWFFTFEANIAEIANGYVFTDFYGDKHYFLLTDEGKYVSAYGEELKIEKGTLLGINYSYFVPCGELKCYFNEDGKLAVVKDNYSTATYSWTNNNLYITDEASNTNTVRFNNGKPTYISVSRFNPATNTILLKDVQYQWTDGNLTKFIDSANIEHNYAYINGLLTANEDELITYSADGRVKKISQPNGAFVKYTYNDTAVNTNEKTSNDIGAVTVTNSKGVSDIRYYSDGFIITNEFNDYSENATYDSNNITGEITDDNIAKTAYIINISIGKVDTEYSKEHPLYEEDSDGNFIFYKYDSENNVTEKLLVISDALTVTDETTFEDAEAVAENKTIYTYDVKGNTTEEVFQKRIDGTLVSQEKTAYSYNDRGSILTECKYQAVKGNWYQTYGQEYAYDDYGNITTKITTEYTNSVNTDTGSIETTSNETTVKYEYDAWCQLIKTITNVDKEDMTVSETEYDMLGRKILISENGKTTSYAYDNKGNGIVMNEDGNVTTYTYSDNGNLISKTQPNGSVATYSYDEYGNLVNRTFNGYSFVYNTLGNVLSASAGSNQLVNYTYSSSVNPNVLNVDFGNGQSIIYSYNEDGEITDVKLGEETKYGYKYFEKTDEKGEVSKEWTELTDYVNYIKKITEGSKTTVNDFNGNFVYSVERVCEDDEITGSFDGTVITIGNDIYTLAVDENKDIFKTNGVTDFIKEYAYANEDLIKIETGHTKTLYSYNTEKFISTLENTLNDVSQIYSYEYDENSNITTETSTITTKEEGGAPLEVSDSIHYTYDEKNQLISAETSAIKYEYTYDDRGNILNKKEYAVTVDENGEKVYTLIDSNTDTYVYDEKWKDELVSYNGQSIAYDAIGNPINYMGSTLTWTMGRQLASFGDISYTYNEDGIRTSKTLNNVTTKFYVDNANIIEQTNGTTTLYFFYDGNGEIVGFKYNNNDYIYIKNAMNDIVGIADSSGNLIASYRYDAWGKVIAITGSNVFIGELNPFRYRGYYYDCDIKMYYLQSRYYDPEIGRFINSDSVDYIGITETDISYNAFAYCNNNPIFSTDEDGSFTIGDLIKLIKNFLNLFNTFKSYADLAKYTLRIKEDSRDYNNRKVNGKYIISVTFYTDTAKKLWTEVWNARNCKKIVETFTELVLEKFKDDKGRDFLFSEDCVYDELYSHLHGYMWSIGEARLCPVRLTGYYEYSKIKNKETRSKKVVIREATKDADIYEIDMFCNLPEAA